MRRPPVSVLEVPGSNCRSVVGVLKRIGAEVSVVRSEVEIVSAKSLVLPGVGAFGLAMTWLAEDGRREAIRQRFGSSSPTLGICLGMQVLFDASEESPGVEGLGIFRGVVKRMKSRHSHVGWANVEPLDLYQGADDLYRECAKKHFFFNHAYYVSSLDPTRIKLITARLPHVPAAVAGGSFVGVQFHPEKSQVAGATFLKSWLSEAELWQ